MKAPEDTEKRGEETTVNKLRWIAAILLALPLLIFGGNYFLQFFSLPEGDGSAGSELLVAMRAGGLMAAVAASHVVIGILLLVGKTRFLAGLLQLPMTLGMVAFHATMLSPGLGLVLGFLVLNLIVVADADRWRVLLE